MARFLVDASLPRAVAHSLIASGHDVEDSRDVGLRTASDEEVARYAQVGSRTVVAGDVDFANIMRFPPAMHAGIIVLRSPLGWTATEKTTRVAAVIATLPTDVTGILVVADEHRVRIFRP